MFVGFCGCVVGVGLRFGWGSCKLFILLPVGELLDWVRRGSSAVCGGLRTQ